MAQAIQPSRPIAQTELRGRFLAQHEGWTAGVLLGVMLVSVTSSVAAANWTDGLTLTTWAALGGMLFGALVARLRLNGLFALLLASIVGTAFGVWLVGTQLEIPDLTWNEKLMLIQHRVDEWLARVLSGGVGTDAFIFLCMCVALAWYLGYLSAWAIFRHHQPWAAILPCGAVLVLNLFYAPPQSGLHLVFFLLSALLLLVRTTLLKRQQAWTQFSVRYASDIGLDFLTYGVVFSGLIILLAWLIPPTAPGPGWFAFFLDPMREPWRNFQQDVTRAFSTVRGTANAAPTTFFGSSLSMGGPIRLGDRPVFDIQAPVGQYWRAVVFDKYTSGGWVTTATETAGLVPYDPRLKTQPMERRRIVTQTVEILLPTDSLVVGTGQPLQVSRPVEAKFALMRAGADLSYFDVHALRLQGGISAGDKYEVVTSLSAADEETLRAASSEPPFYIRNRYLDLPATVPQRVHELAREITAGLTNNYDKARAIEAYLRKNVKYNDEVEPIPAGRDGVDFLLFDRPEGYCNYYASAMAVLARSVGIPARVASGYAVGKSEDGLFHINEANAHSWPELYFGNLGWVEFEPTASRPEIVRPARQPENQGGGRENELESEGEFAGRGLGDERVEALERERELAEQSLLNAPAPPPSLAQVAISLLVVLALITAGGVGAAEWRWTAKMSKLPPGARALEEMYRFAPLAGYRDLPHATPDERAAQLAALVPDMTAQITRVTAWYVRERYGAYPLSAEEQAQAEATHRQFHKRMLRAGVDRFIRNPIQDAWKALVQLARNS